MNRVDHYDAIVIGAGQAGVPLVRCLAVEAKLRTALIERSHVGGTCINEGCTPTKTMIASAKVAYLARRAAEFGIRTGPVAVDLAAVWRRKREIVESWRSGSEHRLANTDGLDLIYGEARFDGPGTLDVRLPGGMFRRFGSAVTILQRQPQVLPQEDPDVAEEITAILREDGIEVLLEAKASRVEPDDRGVRVAVHTPQGDRDMMGSHLLLAAGRVPNTDRLNLDAAGIATDRRGYIEVNERLETSAPGVWAMGDVTGGPAFTHISYDDFRIIRTNLIKGGQATTTAGRLVPYTVFIDPQLGRVGMTERQARERGYQIRVAKLPMGHVARAIEIGETRGFMKAVVDGETDRILGCAVLGVEGGEIMGILQLAIATGVPYQVLKNKILPPDARGSLEQPVPGVGARAHRARAVADRILCGRDQPTGGLPAGPHAGGAWLAVDRPHARLRIARPGGNARRGNLV